MNDFLLPEDLKRLANEQGDLLISFYVDSDKIGNPKTNQIKLKDLTNRAKIILKDSGYSPNEVDKILEPANELVQDDELWLKQKQGFVAFINNGNKKYYRVTTDMPNLVTIGERYHLKPLIRFKKHDNPFWVLYLNKENPELYRATRQAIKRIELDEMPEGLSEALLFKDTDEKAVQFHTKTQKRLGQRPAVHHGQGEPESNIEEALKRYMIDLNNKIVDFISPTQEQLIIAGDNSLHSIYRKVNTYKHLVEDGIEKNISQNRIKILHGLAIEKIMPYWKKNSEAVFNDFSNIKNTKLATTEISEIVNAAYSGRLRSLLIKNGINIWGKYDPSTGQLEQHQEQTPSSVDLISLVAEESYKKGRDINFFDNSEINDDFVIAAILYQ